MVVGTETGPELNRRAALCVEGGGREEGEGEGAGCFPGAVVRDAGEGGGGAGCFPGAVVRDAGEGEGAGCFAGAVVVMGAGPTL